MGIMMDFMGGGPIDGSAYLDREPALDEKFNLREMAIVLAGITSGNKFNVGHRFSVPSESCLRRTVIRRTHEKGVPTNWYVYEITERRQQGEELIVRAKFIGQSPNTPGVKHDQE
jgi:hypothetical protein